MSFMLLPACWGDPIHVARATVRVPPDVQGLYAEHLPAWVLFKPDMGLFHGQGSVLGIVCAPRDGEFVVDAEHFDIGAPSPVLLLAWLQPVDPAIGPTTPCGPFSERARPYITAGPIPEGAPRAAARVFEVDWTGESLNEHVDLVLAPPSQ